MFFLTDDLDNLDIWGDDDLDLDDDLDDDDDVVWESIDDEDTLNIFY